MGMRQRMNAIYNNRLLLLVIAIVLAIVPLFSGTEFLLSELISVFLLAVYAMSYDLLLGYTGIVSFGHAMYFGVGAYAVGILLTKYHNPNMLYVALLVGVVIAVLVGLLIGFLSLRVKDVYFSMITLAFAQLFFIVAEKWSTVTGGDDGISYIEIPTFLQDRTTFYYVSLVFLVLVYLILRRVVNSPLGRTLAAIRENEQRAESLGYNVLRYKLVSIVTSGIVAALAGSMWALFQQYVNTDVLALDQTINALLMTIVGGTGTLIGAVFGSGVITFVHDWMSTLSSEHPIFDRWLMFFGIVYIVIVMFFPKGILGTIGEKWNGKRRKKDAAASNQRSESVV